MKGLLLIFLTICMVLSGGTFASADETCVEIVVSPTGDDRSAGTQDAPIRTLKRAQELVRQRSGEKDCIVTLLSGRYVLDQTLSFAPEDGGQNGYSVTYRGIGEVIVTGNQVLDGWQLHDAEHNIYRAAVPAGFDTRQLYVDGQKARRSRSTRYGDNSYANLRKTCELGVRARENREFYFNPDEVADWNHFEEVELHLLTAWTDNLLRLAPYNDEQNFKAVELDGKDGGESTPAVALKVQSPESERLFQRPHPDITGSTLGYRASSYYYFENAYEFIDEDYEWYLDQSEQTLYFKAPSQMDVVAAVFEAPTLETLVRIEGTAENPVLNLRFEGITFEGSTWLRPSREGLVGGQACQYVLTSTLRNEITAYHPSSAFYAEYAGNLNVQNCTFRNMASTAVDFFCGVFDSSVESCEVYDCAANGISVAKFVEDENTEYHEAYNPQNKADICRNISIVNNSVHDIGTEMEGAVAIIAGYPQAIVIANNEVYNAPYSGISVGFGWTSADNAMHSNVIFRNKIHHVGRVTCDFGAIYTLSKQPASLCARNYIAEVSRQPWFDYGYAAMYFDEQTEGYTITENVLHNIGSDAWGGGVNFNGCAAKNSCINQMHQTGALTGAAQTIAAESGIHKEKTREEIVAEARRYLYDIQNPPEPFDASDYRITRQVAPVAAWSVGDNGTTNAAYAIDKDDNTAFTIEGQTAQSMAAQYLVVELNEARPLSRIEIERQWNAGGMTADNNYWADWCLAVGCEVQGSFDGEAWETIAEMNPWPDGTGESAKEIMELAEPKPYRYVRYIRTKYKTGSDYAVWRWSSDGGNRLNVKEINFYTAQDCEAIPVLQVTATDCDPESKAEYAIDKDPATVYTLSKQTAQSMAGQYLLLETDGANAIEKIILRRQFNAGGMTADNNYWADWCLAVGCEVQGSFDGEAWETIAAMNPWPDDTGERTKEVVELAEPKPYRYVRYIRTKYKTGSDYAVWRWSSDGGNRLNVKEMELYTVAPKTEASIVKTEGTKITISATSTHAQSCTAIAAAYSEDNVLLGVVCKPLALAAGEAQEVTLDVKQSGRYDVFLWSQTDEMVPLCKKMTQEN